MKSPFFFSLASQNTKKNFVGGSFTTVTNEEVPGFAGVSFSSLNLKKRGSLEPIWHPNANKIGYCHTGTSLVSIRTPTSAETFTVQKGDVFFVPKGYIHHIANCGEDEVNIYFAYNHTKPDVMHLSKALLSLSSDVFFSTFAISGQFLEGLKKAKKEEEIALIPSLKKPSHGISSRFKFNIGDSTKSILTKGGYLQIATKANLPILEGLGILGFGLNPQGVVEPHWHTNAGELVYIVKGKTKITVLSPDGSLDVLDVKAGEGAFAPASFFHNIQNVGDEEVEVVAFFSHAEPDYIGISEVIGSYSNEVLASVFHVEPSYFEALKKTAEPLVIVPV